MLVSEISLFGQYLTLPLSYRDLILQKDCLLVRGVQTPKVFAFQLSIQGHRIPLCVTFA